MSDDVRGLPPERGARLAFLVEQCRPLLADDGGDADDADMERVQWLLRELGAGVMDAILVTRELLGPRPGSLGPARDAVLSSAARTTSTELSFHQAADLAERANDVADGLRRTAPRTPGSTRVIAIDGTGGSGKSTLAGAVAARIGGAVGIVRVDDFYRPLPDHEREQLDAEQGYHRYFDWERLRDEVLIPLREGRTARYRVHDWTTGRLGAWREAAAGAVVIVEGVYSARPELAPFYHFTTYVDTPPDLCLQRVRARGENSEEWIRRWRAAEDHYVRTTWPQTRVGLLVRGY
ncbi:AAA family ATPase [Kitasatospora sp. NPDC093558]|uniref:uridine kinase family protein n=1 Tax=Kitasatospora sp. NPDC093558 TaxID=3155201 RepID=UPI00343C7B97